MTRTLLILLIVFSCSVSASEALLDQAYLNYVRGEEAAEPAEREEAFNTALKIYAALAQRYSLGALDYNTGNCYFQLGQYPSAILHYKRALRELPRNERIRENLRQAEQRAGVSSKPSSGPLALLLYPHNASSLRERLSILYILIGISTVLASIALWLPRPLSKRLAIGSVLLSTFCLLSVVYSLHLAPVYAVAIQGAPLYKDAGEHYATVNGEWVLAGSTVRVIESVQNGAWLYIETENGESGYILSRRVRLI